MKKPITMFWLVLVAGLLFGLFSAEKANAGHNQGADITYVNIAPNVYIVKYNFYRDCAGINPGQSLSLTYRAIGCDSTVRSVTMNRSGNALLWNPYCASQTPPGCNGTSANPPAYETNTYTATITLPTLCENWILSCTDGHRPTSRNLVYNYGPYIFAEAHINNVATQTNSSPRFGNNPIPFIGVDRVITYNHNVIDVDGDSLVYSLAPSLIDYNTPVVYGNYTGNGPGTNPYPAGFSPAGTPYPSGNFSPTNPVISRNPVFLDSNTGTMVFEPLDYIGTSFADAQGLNKYTIVVKVEEYRKINGVPTKIGHIRRDMVVVIIDCGTNSLPRVGSFSMNGNNYQHNGVVLVSAGQPLTLTVNAQDNNLTDLVTLTSNAAEALPGATFIVNGGARPTGTISWTPTAAQIREYPYYFTVTATDNACPVKGFQTFALGLRVKNTGGVNGISKSLAAGSFTAFPNPSDGNEVTFKISNQKADKNAEVVIYNVTGKEVDRIAVKAGEEQVTWQKKADLPAGVYFARLTSEAGTQTVKLVHQK